MMSLSSTLSGNRTEAKPQGQETDSNTEQNIPAGHEEFGAAQKIKGFKSKGGKGGESARNSGEEKEPGLCGKEVVFHDATSQHADDKTAKNIDDERSQRKPPAHGVLHDQSGQQIAAR